MPTYTSGEYAAQLLRLSQLVLNVLTRPQESGRQDLSDLISTAASFRVKGERESDPIMIQASGVAYRAASTAFRKYGEDQMQASVKNQGYVDFKTSEVVSQLTFCEYKVNDYDSLEALEDAARQQVEERIAALQL